MNRHNPLTRKELYVALLPLVGIMEKFKETGNGTLKPEEVQLMSDVYPSVQEQARGNMPLNLNTGCPACIKEAFHVFISVYDKLSKDPHVTEDVPPVDGVGKADGKEALEPMTDEEAKLVGEYFVGMSQSENPNDLLTAMLEFVETKEFDETVRAKVAAKIPEVQALVDDHNATHLNEGELAELRILLGVTEDNTLQDFYVALADHVDTLDEPSVKLTNKLDELEAIVNSLPPAPAPIKETSAYERRVAALLNMGFVLNEENHTYNLNDISVKGDFIADLNDEDFKVTLDGIAESLLSPETTNEVASGNPAPEVIGVPMNTPESQTPAQKAAATRARNKAK